MSPKNPDQKNPGFGSSETGGDQETFQIAPVSRIWLPALVAIDASWNSSPWSESTFEGELTNPVARVYGAYTDSQLIGYVVAHVVVDAAHIVSIALAAPWRRKGVGALLLRQFLEDAENAGVSVVTLEVRASNEAAQRLYQRENFESVGIRRQYYTNNNEDALIMKRSCKR